MYEYTFSNYRFTWSTASVGTYYFKVLCSDGKTTECSEEAVIQSGATTTIKSECKFDSDCPGNQVCEIGTCKTVKEDYTWVYVVLVVVITALVLLFLLFRFYKRKSKKTFEGIFRKWIR
jgi:hypothetical protein